ncbi:MAG TPA: type II toxin-antitoxin system prevent-host-death family antitoxin [Xanthobacteraceae bacterium]|nr:type II toxin-antitoxin system prevent-host-death family antitoxin [Xanthobacteraceae bacterium]
MHTIGLFDAKNKLSALIDRVARGEEVLITRRGRPVAKLVPVKADHDVERARAAMRRIRERAEKFGGPFNWEEWKRYRDEGRE